ncbi:MAG: GDSL-type esterase/lipase family protein, partial [Candidatus Thiodiazotropha sp.]
TNQNVMERENSRNDLVLELESNIDLNKSDSVQDDNLRLTSTPEPKPCHQPPRAHQCSDVQRSQREQATRSRPVPKPRNSIPSKKSTKKILLIGDSLISGINKNGLKEHVYKHGISGGTIDSLLSEIAVYDLYQFSHTIIYVGGNNASNRTDIEYFQEKYEQLLLHIKQNSQCKILLVNSCPRGDTDISEVNEVIRGLSEDHEVELVDVNDAFFNKKGELIRRYYSWDSIHLSDSGVKRLVGTINNRVNIVQDFSWCVFTGKQRSRPLTGRIQQMHNSRQRHITKTKTLCTKCGEANHETKDCKHAEQLKCHLCGYYGHKSRRCGNQ